MNKELPPATLPFPVTRSAAQPAETAGNQMVGHFATFDDFYEVDSMLEGHFLERIDPGAFNATIAESRDSMKVLYDHGQDPQIGNKILGTIESLSVDAKGPAYTVDLFDTSYNRDLRPGLEAGAYGSSFRFRVQADSWDQTPKRSEHNPAGIPERTITEAQVFEFGPVTFPANPGATAGMRSTTDAYYKRAKDPEQFEALQRSAEIARGLRSGGGEVKAAITALVGELGPEVISPRKQEKKQVDQEYVSPEDRAARITEVESMIQRKASEFPGVMPAGPASEFDALVAERTKLLADSKAWDDRQALLQSFLPQADKVERTAPNIIVRKPEADIYDIAAIDTEARSLADKNRRVKENALRSIDSQKLPRGIDADNLVEVIEHKDMGEEGEGEIARRVLLTGNPQYRSFFNKYLRGVSALATPEEQRAAALAVTGTTTTGGYAVPYIFDPTMIHIGAYTAQNPYRAACRVETITNGNNWLAVTVGNIAMAYASEAAAGSEGGPTFAQPSYTVQTATGFVTLSVEAMEDRPDITGELASVFAEGKATLEENKFTLGTGAPQPNGMFVSGQYTVSLTATNDVTALLDFTVTEGALPLRFRQNACWFMNRSTIRQLQILDTTYRYFSGAGIQWPGNVDGSLNGAGQLHPATPPNPQSNTGLYLLGYPIWEVPSAVSTLTTDAAVIAVLCDPKTFIIVDRIGMNIEVIPQMLNGATPSFPTLQRGVVAWFRNTAKVHTADGGRQVKVQ